MGVVIRKSRSKDTLELSGREGGRSKGIKGEILEDRTVFLVSVFLPPNGAPYGAYRSSEDV